MQVDEVQKCLIDNIALITFYAYFPWISLAVGALGILIVLIHIFRAGKIEIVSVVLFLICIAFISATITNVFPTISGKLTDPELSMTSFQKVNPEYFCYYRDIGPSTPPALTPDKVTPLPKQTTTDLGPVKNRLTWIFYGPGRVGDASNLAAALINAGGLVNPPREDDFSAVKFNWISGQIRVIYATDADREQAKAIGSYLQNSFKSRSLSVDGPYPNVARKPVQVHFY